MLDPKRDSYKAAAWNLAAGAMELVAGGAGSSLALVADTAHNLSDSAAYGINAATYHKTPEKHLNWRKRAARLICLGALAVGVKAGHGLIYEETKRPEPIVPVVAGAALAINMRVHRKMDQHDSLEHGLSDNARHARWDLYCARITLGAATIAALGVAQADNLGAVIVSGMTIVGNNPWQIK